MFAKTYLEPKVSQPAMNHFIRMSACKDFKYIMLIIIKFYNAVHIFTDIDSNHY